MSENAAKRSRELFESGYYCAESVLLAIAEANDIESPLIPRIATGLCSGTSRTGGVCGAVNGAILGINLLSGRDAPGEPVDRNYALVQGFLKLFRDRFGSLNCRELIGCDLGSDEGQEFFGENNLIELCLQYTEEATGMALSLVQD